MTREFQTAEDIIAKQTEETRQDNEKLVEPPKRQRLLPVETRNKLICLEMAIQINPSISKITRIAEEFYTYITYE